MKRYYLSPIVGTGQKDDPYRALVANYRVNHSAIIPIGFDGRPTSTWALCIVETNNHVPLLTDASLSVLPDFPADARLSAMGIEARAQAENALQKFGISTGLLDPSSKSLRETIRSIGKLLDPAFHEDSFDVS